MSHIHDDRYILSIDILMVFLSENFCNKSELNGAIFCKEKRRKNDEKFLLTWTNFVEFSFFNAGDDIFYIKPQTK